MSKLLEVRSLCKTYGSGSNRLEVLTGIDLDLNSSTTTALVGASGAGKSTLMHLLGALDRPTSGTVFFRGEDIFKKNERELAAFRNRSIGFVFQFHHLLPEFTALENVMMPALIARIPRSEAREIAESLLTDVGLSQRMTHRPGELSGGEQQRVAIARALVLEPELLLADEPTGNLDMKTSDNIHSMLAELQIKKGLTLVVVTHNERLAAAMGTTIHLLDGKVEKTTLYPGDVCPV
ncbi:MAG: ABC transporter ATP-binding protein [Desulfuromonadaceae bacterium]|nr:ABC transporter ATP-binding protein [Desulfuromonadaceae bacterium]MDD2854387.1 ABC transporter ATP-binding protein [Desulfuromonadaceae bacterium]